MRPDGLLFSYPGSKWRMAKKFQRYYAPHRVFVDVFGGSAALIARQERPAVEVYNDLDFTVYNVFAMIQDVGACKEVLRLLETTTTDREQYTECRRVLGDPTESSVRRAWAFLCCGTIGWAAHPALANGWTRNDRQRRDLRNLPGKIRWWHERLQNVHVENRPWQEIIDRYDSVDALFVCDPPYLPQVLRGSADQYYQCRMDADAHIELIEKLRTIQGHVLLCGYNHPLYTKLLFHWRRIKFFARETMGGAAGKRQEVVWLDYENDGRKVEGNRLRIAQRYVQIMGGEEDAVKYVERIKRLKRLLK